MSGMKREMENSGFHVIWSEEKRIVVQRVPVLLTLLNTSGMLFCLQGMFREEMSYIPLVVMIVLAVAAAYFMGKNRKCLLIGIGFGAGLFGITQFVAGSYFFAGAADFLNRILAQYNYITGKTVDYFVVPQCNNMTVAYFCFMGWLAVILAGYLQQLTQRKHPIILFLCWMPVLAGGIYLQLTLDGILIAWAAASVTGAFAYGQTETKEDRVLAVAIIVVLAGLIGISGWYFRVVSYQPSERIEAMKKSMIKQVEHSRFGVPDYPEGDLEGNVNTSSETRLKVHLSSEARIYLKGYTGSIFEDSGWSLLEAKAYGKKYEGMIREYQYRLFHPLAQLSCYMEAAEQVEGAGIAGEKIDVTVENTSASQKYTYLPYGVSFESLTALNGIYQDVYVLSKGKEKQKQSYQVNVTKQDALIGYQGMQWLNDEADVNEETANYRMSEADYRKFVYKNYLAIEEEIESKWKKELSEVSFHLMDITKEVRDILLKWGEKESQWTPMEYATYGTLLYRYYGIPARYIEGYLAEGKGDLDITARNAHAWVEVYKDGVGWLPVDVTPGFYGEISAPEVLKQQQTTVNQGQKTEENVKKEEKKEESATHNVAWFRILFIALGILAAVILIVLLAFWIYYRRVWKRRQRELSEGDVVDRLRCLSSYLYELTRYLSMEEEALSAGVKNVLSVLWYSLTPEKILEETHVSEVETEVEVLQKQIWKKAGRIEKYLLRYWHHLEFPVMEKYKEQK